MLPVDVSPKYSSSFAYTTTAPGGALLALCPISPSANARQLRDRIVEQVHQPQGLPAARCWRRAPSPPRQCEGRGRMLKCRAGGTRTQRMVDATGWLQLSIACGPQQQAACGGCGCNASRAPDLAAPLSAALPSQPRCLGTESATTAAPATTTNLQQQPHLPQQYQECNSSRTCHHHVQPLLRQGRLDHLSRPVDRHHVAAGNRGQGLQGSKAVRLAMLYGARAALSNSVCQLTDTT